MMFSEVARERTSSTLVEEGLYVLRYVESAAQEPPLVHVRVSFGSENKVKLILAPNTGSAMLSRPGTAMVVLAEQQASLQITVQSSGRSGALEATLRFEPLHENAETQSALEEPSPIADFKQLSSYSPEPLTRDSADFQLLAHVARRGDVVVGADCWIAGPDAPSPIEAIAVKLASSAQTGLQYQVMGRGSLHWSDWVEAGTFAGTKGQALALTGIRFRLTGSSSKWQLQGSALFLGASVLDQSGEAIELKSATGQDPLVGLKLDIQPVAEQVVQAAKTEWGPTAASERKSRVRVFRAGVEQR